MVPVIRIGDSTWERLKRRAVPLEDSPDDVLTRVLDLADEHDECRRPALPTPLKANRPKVAENKRAGRGQKVPEVAYESPILETLYELGAKGRANEVLVIVEQKMKHLLGDFDYQALPSGQDFRWRKTANFARNTLVQNGLLKRDSERGTWELTELGIKSVESRGA